MPHDALLLVLPEATRVGNLWNNWLSCSSMPTPSIMHRKIALARSLRASRPMEIGTVRCLRDVDVEVRQHFLKLNQVVDLLHAVRN